MRTHQFRDQNGSLTKTLIFSKKKSSIFLIYLISSFIKQHMKKIIRADIKKIKNLLNSFVADNLTKGWRGRNKFGKVLFEKNVMKIPYTLRSEIKPRS